ncbi:MAG: LPS assembly protein LptD [Thermodesulfobacteriota bacterium]|nr:LPS assembly protein LptD [Thermodesulfobacteriota bacterium]
MKTHAYIQKNVLLILVFLLMLPATGLTASGSKGALAEQIKEEKTPSEFETSPSPGAEPWHIEAFHLTYFHSSGVILGEGSVQVWRGDLKVCADRIMYDRRNARIWANGNVVIYLDMDVLKGTEGELDLNTSTGTVENADLFLQRNNIHLLAKQIWKTGPEEYKAKHATISTCPLPKQAWNFKCRDLKLTIGGMAFAKSSFFNIRDIPVLYSPWVVLPINKYRKTGLLLPYFSTSKRNGAELNVPFFWAINDSMDATFYQHSMGKRGWMEGIEFRYVFSPEDKGILRYNFLVDTLEDDNFNNDRHTRGNEKRWWLRAKAEQHLPWNFEAKVDVDLISDRDYLLEFDQGPMGYDKTDSIFRKTFGRSLSDETDLIRPSSLQITKLAQDMFFGGEGRYNDNQGKQDSTVQTYPRLVLHGFRKPLFNSPFYYDWATSYVHYWREEGIKEQRLHMEPGVSLPLNLYNLADLILSGNVEETMYEVSGHDPEQHPDSHSNRLLYNLNADLSTTFARTYHLSGEKTMRHSIRPGLTYQYRPFEDQDDLPEDIDTLDRLEPMNRITLSMLSFFSSKTTLGNNKFAYTDVVRFSLEQSYDTEENSRNLSGEEDLGHFSDIYAELDFKPFSNLFMRYDTSYNVYGKGFTEYNFLGRLSNSVGDTLDLEYRYNCLAHINEVNLEVHTAFSPSWYGMCELKRNVAEDSELESVFGLRYQSTCWALDGRFKKDTDETSFTFHLELLGIGGWGSKN